MSSKQFTAQTFQFLYQVNDNKRLLAIDLKVAVTLTRHFNEKDQGGRAFPSCETIADEAGVDERSVRRAVRRMEQHGHLRVVWGKQGRGHPNQYWMIVIPASVPVLDSGKPAPAPVLEPGKPASVARRKPASVAIKPAPAPENHLKNHVEGTPTESPSTGREIEDRLRDLASRDRGRASDDAARSVEDAQGSFSQLHALWRRGWTSDDDPKEIATARAAYAKAIAQGTQPDAILESAKTWVAAADAPRFLPPLATWLATRGFAQPPPGKKKAKRTSRSAPRRSTANEVALAMLAAGEREG